MTLDYTFERCLELAKRDATASGLELGRAEGHELKQTLIQLVYKKYVKNLTVEEASEMLEVDEETIRRIYSAIKTVGTDNVEEIYKQYLRESDKRVSDRAQG